MLTFLYHGNCPDGFGAALSARLCHGVDNEFIPVIHGEPAPDVTGKDVILMDFCYPVPEMKIMADQAKTLFVLDHHKGSIYRTKPIETRSNVRVSIDTSRSGAVLAWEFFHPGKPVPRLFRHIEDRDCWFWRDERSSPILMWLDTLPYDFDTWGGLLNYSDTDWDHILKKGHVMQTKFDSLVQSAIDSAATVTIGGHTVGLSFGTEEFTSAIGAGLAKKFNGYGMVLITLPTGAIKASLRSIPGHSALKLAERMGGGGHEHAAGFRCAPETLTHLLSGKDPLAVECASSCDRINSTTSFSP